jgi:membrane associated rhomboid family serine protease
MRAPYRSSSNFSASFGPGPLTPAIKALMVANVAAFLVSMIVPAITLSFGLLPADVIGSLQIWQPVTYMFLHGGVFHLLFNMLALWMFGVELERTWGSRFFMRFYFIVGIGAALTTLLLSLMPLPFADQLYDSLTIGASGAVYGVLLAYGLYFPRRPIYLYFFAHTTHLGGLIVAYLYLKGGSRTRLVAEIKYRYLKWRINQTRRRFAVHEGGRSTPIDRVH